MAVLKFCSLLLLLLAHQSAGEDPETFIFGGNPVANLNLFPSFVGVQHGTVILRFCGGVILNANHVLTAGRCVLDANNHLIAASQLFIRGGNLALDQSAIFPVLLVYVHPTYNPSNNMNDLAVLRTAITIPLEQLHLAAVNFNHDIVGDGTNCQIAGWNVIPGTVTPPLSYLQMPIYNRDQCSTEHGRVIAESMICTRGSAVNAAVCESNIGGGLFCNGNASAILSFGTTCGIGPTIVPPVYTQIRFYEQWITSQMNRNDIPQPGPTPAPGVPPGNDSSLMHLSIVLVFSIVGNLARNIL